MSTGPVRLHTRDEILRTATAWYSMRHSLLVGNGPIANMPLKLYTKKDRETMGFGDHDYMVEMDCRGTHYSTIGSPTRMDNLWSSSRPCPTPYSAMPSSKPGRSYQHHPEAVNWSSSMLTR